MGLPLKIASKLQLELNTDTSVNNHITLVLWNLHYLPIYYQSQVKVLMVMYKA